MVRLGLVERIRCCEFPRETGFDAHRLFADAVGWRVVRGLLSAGEGRIVLTRRGRLPADAVIADLPFPPTVDQPAGPAATRPFFTAGDT